MVFPVSFRGAGAPEGPDRNQTLKNLPVVTTEVTLIILIIDGYITGYLKTLWLNVLQEVVGYINWWRIQTAEYIYIYYTHTHTHTHTHIYISFRAKKKWTLKP